MHWKYELIIVLEITARSCLPSFMAKYSSIMATSYFLFSPFHWTVALLVSQGGSQMVGKLIVPIRFFFSKRVHQYHSGFHLMWFSSQQGVIGARHQKSMGFGSGEDWTWVLALPLPYPWDENESYRTHYMDEKRGHQVQLLGTPLAAVGFDKASFIPDKPVW